MTDVHLWLGLGSGIILFLVCFSGTMLVFEEEIKSAFAEEMKVSVSSEKLGIEELNKKLVGQGTIASITLPSKEYEPYEYSIKTSPKDRRGSVFMVDPYTGSVLEPQKSSLEGFFGSMFKLHRWLLLDSKIGRPIVGIATIIFLFLSITGIIIWFPKKWKWKAFKPGFKIKFSANWKRINHDLHNTLGFYSCIFLVIMILTGLCWSFGWYRNAGSQLLGAKIFGGRGAPEMKSLNINNEHLGLEAIYKISNSKLNYEGSTSISLPSDKNGVYQIRKYNDSNWSPVTSDVLVLDSDGSVLKKEIFSENPLNVQISALIRPIHTGQIFGIFSKMLYFLACLIATSLPVTGTIIWLNKMKKKKKN